MLIGVLRAGLMLLHGCFRRGLNPARRESAVRAQSRGQFRSVGLARWRDGGPTLRDPPPTGSLETSLCTQAVTTARRGQSRTSAPRTSTRARPRSTRRPTWSPSIPSSWACCTLSSKRTWSGARRSRWTLGGTPMPQRAFERKVVLSTRDTSPDVPSGDDAVAET